MAKETQIVLVVNNNIIFTRRSIPSSHTEFILSRCFSRTTSKMDELTGTNDYSGNHILLSTLLQPYYILFNTELCHRPIVGPINRMNSRVIEKSNVQ